jgi:long-chain acyl-CoA synthetase
LLTLVSLLQRNALMAADRPALMRPGQAATTWGELVPRLERAAGLLSALGVSRGDRFAVVGRNSQLLFELMHAGVWCGAVPVPLNHRLAPAELAPILDDAAVRLVAADDAHAPLFLDGPLQAWRDRLLLLEGGPPCGRPRYEPLVDEARPAAAADPAECDVALLLYTGGTTGHAKGVPLSHRNVVANALQVTSLVGYRPDDVYLHVAPMFHSADLLATGVTLHGGAHAFLPQFAPADFIRAVGSCGVTRTMLTPQMLLGVLDHPATTTGAMSTLRQLFYGSAPMAAPAIARALERLPGVDLWQGYGLTETSPLLTALSMPAHLEGLADPAGGQLASAGQPLPGVDLRIVSADGRPAAAGEPGEVWARGPNVLEGYVDRRDTEAALADGWFRTGDIGRLDARGFLTLLDRAKDMVITGGENVYSIEVESVLLHHPAVREAAVIGVPDARHGEVLLAVVACHSGTALDVGTIVGHCRGRLGGYKIPRRLQVVDELPRTALGKVDKPALRRRFGSAPS